MIGRFRILFDGDEDVLRDVEITLNDNLETFHNLIINAFGLDLGEMSSFYISNSEWEQGLEISLFDMNDNEEPTLNMSETTLENLIEDEQLRLIFVYDFMSLWTFLIELVEVSEPVSGVAYPHVIFSHGQLPEQAPEKSFESEGESMDFFDDAEDYSDEEDFYDDYENY